MSKITQKEMVLEYIRQHGSISSMEGYEHLNITDTRTIMSRIRADLKGTPYEVYTKKIYPVNSKAYARWYITTGKSIHCPHCEALTDAGLVDWHDRHTAWTCPACSKIVREGFKGYEAYYPDPPKELRGDNTWVNY